MCAFALGRSEAGRAEATSSTQSRQTTHLIQRARRARVDTRFARRPSHNYNNHWRNVQSRVTTICSRSLPRTEAHCSVILEVRLLPLRPAGDPPPPPPPPCCRRLLCRQSATPCDAVSASIIASGDVLPNIHAVLLPKKTKGDKGEETA